MNNEKLNIDNLFRQELDGHAEVPPSAVWERLEKKLDNRPLQRPPSGTRKYWSYGIICGMLLLGVLLVRQFSGSSSAPGNAIALNNTGNSTTKPSGTEVSSDAPASNKIDAANGTPADTRAAADNAGNGVGQPIASENNKTAARNIANAHKSMPAGKSGATAKRGASKITGHRNIEHNPALYGASAAKGGPNAGDDQPENEYAGSASTANTSKVPPATTKAEEQPKPATQKAAQTLVKKPLVATMGEKEAKHATRASFKRFEAGIKSGYEMGFDNDAAKKAVISPYVQYRISSKLAIMLQPSIKSAYLASRRIGEQSSYYQVDDTSVVKGTPYKTYLGTQVWFYKTQVNYKETYDSIVKSNYLQGSYTELELPILLKYYLGKNFSVYGGVNVVYSKLLNLSEHTQINKAIVADSINVVSQTATYVPVPGISSAITHTAPSYVEYSGPQYPASNESQFRIGYMLGFSYQYDRWLFDGLVQQANAKATTDAGYNLNSALSAPYFRLTIGYKITK